MPKGRKDGGFWVDGQYVGYVKELVAILCFDSVPCNPNHLQSSPPSKDYAM